MSNHDFEDYTLKVDYLKSQFDRLLSRFNYFLTVEMALFGFFGWIAFEKHDMHALRASTFLGIFVSLLWYIVAAEDEALVKEYRSRVEDSAKKLGDGFEDRHAARQVNSTRNSLVSWYWRPLRVTCIPVYVALFTFIIWLVLLLDPSLIIG